MRIGDVIPEAALMGCSPLVFERDGLRCAVADGWGEFFGFLVGDGSAEVVSTGWSREWVASALSKIASDRFAEHEAQAFAM